MINWKYMAVAVVVALSVNFLIFALFGAVPALILSIPVGLAAGITSQVIGSRLRDRLERLERR
jgi:hypothetical protein